MKIWKPICCLLLIGLVAACNQKTALTSSFEAEDLSAKLGAGGYVQKVDNAVFIMDASSSMFGSYQGRQKSARAKEIMQDMIKTIPGLDLQTGLHVFGPVASGSNEDSRLVFGMTAFDPEGLVTEVDKVKVGGLTPLSKSLDQSIISLMNTKGKIAGIIVSDGRDTSGFSPVEAAAMLKKTYGDRICIYTVLIGDDAEGKYTLDEIAQAGECGFATSEKEIASSNGMADFVERVFLEKAPKIIAKAEPPSPVMVQKITYETVTKDLDVKFDFDKAEIRAGEENQLDEFAQFLQEHPDTSAVLEGHTDSYGPAAYNEKLSHRRAESIKNYLVEKYDIDPARLTTKGLGENNPIASNETRPGRQRNRRTMANVSASKAVITTTVKEE